MCSRVEIFVVQGNGGPKVLVNEIAPRVHNSGHWTLDGASISQFEQHIRAIAGWPLGKPVRHGPVTMTNLIGDDILRAAAFMLLVFASWLGSGAILVAGRKIPCSTAMPTGYHQKTEVEIANRFTELVVHEKGRRNAPPSRYSW